MKPWYTSDEEEAVDAFEEDYLVPVYDTDDMHT